MERGSPKDDKLEEIKSEFHFPETCPDMPASSSGWLGVDTKFLLAHAVKGARLAVELGSWLGLSARYMADCAPETTVICIDTWIVREAYWSIPECVPYLDRLYERFLSSCWGYRDRIVPIRKDTVSGLHFLHARGISPDLIYVDAGHDYESVLADVGVASRFFPEAEIVGDDIGIPDVRAALSTLLAYDRIAPVAEKGNCWWRISEKLPIVPGASPLQLLTNSVE